MGAPADGAVWRVRPGPRLVMRTIDVDPGVGDLAFGAGALSVANPVRGTLARVDPAAGRVVRTFRLGGAPRAVAAGADGIWVAVGGDRARPAADVRAGTPVHEHCSATFYRGSGRPDRLIVTDLPLQGGVRLSAQQMAQSAAFVLGERGFRAGGLRVGIQSCDDSVARTGLFDPARCAANARAYAADPRVAGVIGTLNSPCAAAALPELARAPGGPLMMVSPANSYAGLTRAVPGAPPGELRSLYPRDAGTSRACSRPTTARRSPWPCSPATSAPGASPRSTTATCSTGGPSPTGSRAAAEGSYVGVTGLVDASLGARGRAFVDGFGATLPGVEVEPTAVYTAEATGVLLDAIARSDGTRAGVLDAVMATRLQDGLTGAVRFDAKGDIVAPAITVLRVRRGARGPRGFPGTVLDRVVRSAAP